MSDPRYRGGILQGIRSQTTPGVWPDEVPGLGPRRGGQPLGLCSRCNLPAAYGTTTFVMYGNQYLCKRHALEACK